MVEQEQRFPDWNKLYKEQPVESMPWFKPDLDEDLLKEIKDRKIHGGTFLDIGTGPATQAIQLSKMGFKVTGTDLSEAAIKRAQGLDTNIEFIADDILKTKLKGPFDYVFDRGCFHVLPPDQRPLYVENLHRLLKPGGLAFIKCFSIKQPETGAGPYRFSNEDIQKIFGGSFKVESTRYSQFTGGDIKPQSIFSVLKR